jgi:hypothetical protein
MMSNVSLYPFDLLKDEYVAYELSAQGAPSEVSHRAPAREVHGQIRFDAPCVCIPDVLNHHLHISIEELEIELERSARRQERQ